MTTHRIPLFCLSLGLAAAPAVALAQVSGESPDMGPRGDAPPVASASAAEARSPLWMAIDAVHRQRDTSRPDRRLSAEQRLQMREQIRRASMRPELEQPPAAQLGQR